MVQDGVLQYVSMTGHRDSVHEDKWVSEAPLWTHWVHLGTLEAAEDSRLHVLDAREFQEIVCQFEHMDFDPRTYAQHFVDALNGDGARVGAINDLSMGNELSFLQGLEDDELVQQHCETADGKSSRSSQLNFWGIFSSSNKRSSVGFFGHHRHSTDHGRHGSQKNQRRLDSLVEHQDS